MSIGIIIGTLVILVLLAVAGIVFSLRQSRRRSALEINKSALKRATMALDASGQVLDYMAAIAFMQGQVAYKEIVRKMAQDWGATPTQVCFVLISNGVNPRDLDHPLIITSTDLYQLVQDINAGHHPELPQRRADEPEAPAWKGATPAFAGTMLELPTEAPPNAAPGRPSTPKSGTQFGIPAVTTRAVDDVPPSRSGGVYPFDPQEWSPDNT